MFTKFAAAEILEVKGSDHRVRNASLEKIADFDDYKTSDGYLYTRVRAISSRVNKNHDGWPSEELKKSYSTFLGKPIFVDHHNSNHKKTRGVIVDARIHVEKDAEKASSFDPYYANAPENHKPPTWIELLLEVDAKTFPKLARSIVEGHIDGVSMGCNVERSKCSICDNWATKPSEYCSHIRQKGSTFKVASEEKVAYEDCYDIGFFEISYVFDPADETALVSEVRSSKTAGALDQAPWAAEIFSNLGKAHPDIGISYVHNKLVQQGHQPQDASMLAHQAWEEYKSGNTPAPPAPSTEMADQLWPDHLPWGEAEQNYYRNASGAETNWPAIVTGLKDQGMAPAQIVQYLETQGLNVSQAMGLINTDLQPRPINHSRPISHIDKEGNVHYALTGEEREYIKQERDKMLRENIEMPSHGRPAGPAVTNGPQTKVVYDQFGVPHEVRVPGDPLWNDPEQGLETSRELPYANLDYALKGKNPGHYQSSVRTSDNPLPQSMELKSPDHVNTLRQVKPCPVCGSEMDDGRCDVCNFEEPPEGLNNPDIQKAQQIMEQQEATQQQPPGPQGLDPTQPGGGGAPPAGGMPPQMTSKLYRLADYLDDYYQGHPDSHYENAHADEPCPNCRGEGCELCHYEGSVTPEEAYQYQQANESRMDGLAEQRHYTTNSGSSNSITNVRVTKINRNEKPVLPPTSRPSDKPKDVKVISNQARPVESKTQTERNMKYSKEQIEGFIAELQKRKIASTREQAIELIKAAMKKQAEGTQPSDSAGQPDQRVPVDGVGGFDNVTPQNFADQTVDVEGVGGFDNNPESETDHVDVTKSQDTANSGPTKTWSGDTDQAKAVTPDTAEGGPIGAPIKSAGSTDGYNSPQSGLFGDELGAEKSIDVEKEIGKEQVGLPTGTWSDNKVNGLEQADPTTTETDKNIDVNLHAGRTKLLSALKVAEQEIQLGLVEDEDKFNRIEQLEQQSEDALNARLDTLSMVKKAGLSVQPTREVTARSLLQAPRMAHSAAAVDTTTTPRFSSQSVEDAAIFM